MMHAKLGLRWVDRQPASGLCTPAITSVPTEILREHPHAPSGTGCRKEGYGMPVERTVWPGRGVEGLIDRAFRLLDRGTSEAGSQRAILGIAGAPASGKSTVARLLLAELDRRRPGAAVGVGMDAFHIGHRVLAGRGQTGIKGAPETFDAEGYLHLLRRIRTEAGPIYAPEFERDIEDSLAHVVEIRPEVGLVITEGNYLLLESEPWVRVRELLDEAWFVHLADSERQRRMMLRHQHHGHDHRAARERTFGNDERNAQLVNAAQNRPDLWIEQEFEPNTR
jgi:pantothenate kinase